MNKRFLYSYGFLLFILLLVTPGYGQSKKNLPKALRHAITDTPAFQAALRHSQAVRTTHKSVVEQPVSLQTARATPIKGLVKEPVTALAAVQLTCAESATDQQVSNEPLPKRRRTFRKNSPKKPPQQWLSELETFIEQNKRFPTIKATNEQQLLSGISRAANQLGENHPITRRIRELRAQYPYKPRGNPPSYWLEKLEIFVQENGYYPKTKNPPEERELYIAINSILQRLPPKDPVVQRIRELRAQYPYEAPGNPAGFWLKQLEIFIQENGYYPKYQAPQPEATLRAKLDRIVQRVSPNNPVVQRIRELRAQYPSDSQSNPPSYWLEKLEYFIWANGYFPRYNGTNEEKSIYRAIRRILEHRPDDDPIVTQIHQLKEKLNQPKNP